MLYRQVMDTQTGAGNTGNDNPTLQLCWNEDF